MTLILEGWCLMKVRAWVIVGDASAAASLPTSGALVGPSSTPVLPNAGEVEPGRWIVWEPVMTPGPLNPSRAVTLVCVEIPL